MRYCSVDGVIFFITTRSFHFIPRGMIYRSRRAICRAFEKFFPGRFPRGVRSFFSGKRIFLFAFQDSVCV